jgi:hypothetical protein
MWIWYRILNPYMDRMRIEFNDDKIRKQKGTLLPSGATPNDFFYKPEKWQGVDQLLPISQRIIDKVEADLPELTIPLKLVLLPVSPQFDELASNFFDQLDAAEPTMSTAWPLWAQMMAEIKAETTRAVVEECLEPYVRPI